MLVVEDEFLVALHLAGLLAAHGWRVLGPAAGVAEALGLLAAAALPPAAAVLDVNLRGGMVAPVAEALRASGVPFVLASAYERPECTAPALAGAPNVGKPVDEARLLAALAQAVAP